MSAVRTPAQCAARNLPSPYWLHGNNARVPSCYRLVGAKADATGSRIGIIPLVGPIVDTKESLEETRSGR
ncbi:hypothetical protein GCM10009627_14850 [Curtobacterium herbarum]|uniref:Uncharacterized protein n=1 Tax=Curtobacterium herbarum TaxID=150122 RepID=A0ABN1ZC29_9MICO